MIHPLLCNAKPNFYPRSPCGERRQTKQTCRAGISISIHALLAESDDSSYGALAGASISIHALLAESDAAARMRKILQFNFYPRSPCGERLDSSYGALDGASISIHALLAESDACVFARSVGAPISIHALLAESDACVFARSVGAPISIHALLAESDSLLTLCPFLLCRFLSTLSLRRATRLCTILYSCPGNFYPRSPCGERLPSGSKYSGCSAHFYPRSPCGERPLSLNTQQRYLPISIHALLAESDQRT